MKQSKMPADPNRRAKATVDAIDAIVDAWPEPVPQEKDPSRGAQEARRVERRKAAGGEAQSDRTISDRSPGGSGSVASRLDAGLTGGRAAATFEPSAARIVFSSRSR